MAEPQPSSIQEGAEQADALPANAEDRKAAAAMAGLDSKDSDDAPKKEVDMKALSNAMKHLEVGSAQSKTAAATKKKEDEVKKPLVKVDAADVALLVSGADLRGVRGQDRVLM